MQKNGLELLTELTELRRKEIIRVPEWVNKKLEAAVNQAIVSKTGKDTELPLALLTLQMITGDNSLERKAQRIINRCYRSAFDGGTDLDKRIESLHTAVTCCDYVSRFSVRKAATAWNELSAQALSSDKILTPRQTFRLLEIAKECEGYANISADSQDRLKEMLSNMAQSECLEAMALNEIANLRF